MDLFQKYNWGLIVYDEVHLLPAPVFRAVSEIQARRRLGLTATLLREDGKEDDVFSLIGPKRFDKPWKELEKQGYIAEAICTEIRVPLDAEKRMEYATADLRSKYRIAMENPAKMKIVDALLQRHYDRQRARDRPVPRPVAADQQSNRCADHHRGNPQRGARGAVRLVQGGRSRC
jgi:DNA excision repair protein ERCC-3